MTEKMRGREVIFEFRPVGNVMRVTAVDAMTATEVVVQCPLHSAEITMKNMGLQRLEYVLKKNGVLA